MLMFICISQFGLLKSSSTLMPNMLVKANEILELITRGDIFQEISSLLVLNLNCGIAKVAQIDNGLLIGFIALKGQLLTNLYFLSPPKDNCSNFRCDHPGL